MIGRGKFVLELLVTILQLLTSPLLILDALTASVVATATRVRYEEAFVIIAAIVIGTASPLAGGRESSRGRV
jgi:hypothetical protein